MNASQVIETPDQKQAIARMMAAIKRRQRSDHRTVGNFPRFVQGMTTAEYVTAFLSGRTLVKCEHVHAKRAAPWLTGAEVTAEHAEEEEASWPLAA